MAPFKLKFRMGSGSRSTSLETTASQLTSTSITSSTTTIDSEYHSLCSLNNDQRNLLPEQEKDDLIGYSNPAIMEQVYVKEEDPAPIVLQFDHPLSENNPPNETALSQGHTEFHSMEDLSEEPKCSSANTAIDMDHNEETRGKIAKSYSKQDSEEIRRLSSDEESESQIKPKKQRNKKKKKTIQSTVIDNKTSKKLYKEISQQWGITCEMSEQCRCMDCQGQYFNWGEIGRADAGDGGLGAGASLYLDKVAHGYACSIL